MMLFNSWYYSFSPTLAAQIRTHPTQRTIFRDALYPLFAILYASYYSYLLLSPLNREVGAGMAGVVAAGLIGLIYLGPAAYLTSRILRRKFRSLRLTPSRVYGWVAVSAAVTGLAYSTGQVLPLSIAATNLVLSSLTIGCVLGGLTLTRLERVSFRLLARVRPLYTARMALYSATHAPTGRLHALEHMK